MSYILDALRKSEQQRRRTGAPDLTTEHEGASAGGGRRWLLPGILVLALTGNAAALGLWLLRDGGERGLPALATGAAEPLPEPLPEPVARTGEEANRAGGTSSAAMRGAATASATPAGSEADTGAAAESEAMEPDAEPVSIHALPERIRARIPPLRFSTHIYAEEAAWREVGINGRIHGEGDRIQGMRLERITETGVILELDGWRFRVSVLENWDY